MPTQLPAQEPPPKAVIAIVGDADRVSIGQDGFCGSRSEVEKPSDARFRIPAGVMSYFYIRSKFRTVNAEYTCEGEFSFVPEASALHIIRYTFPGTTCLLEMYRSDIGGTPTPFPFKRENGQACVGK